MDKDRGGVGKEEKKRGKKKEEEEACAEEGEGWREGAGLAKRRVGGAAQVM